MKHHHNKKKNESQTAEFTENTVAAVDAAVPAEDAEGKIDAAQKEALPDVEVVGVSFRSNNKKYYFAPGRLSLHIGDEVIVETARGMEFGKISIVNTFVPASAITPPLRIVTRVATDADRERYERNRELENDAVHICREKIAQHKLDMNLIGAEYTFDNTKLLFYFTAEGRVDFRELVKDLASVFHTRIELRQVGIRDEAKILGGLGACGRPFCCATFLPDFAQVSIKMAKEQNFSLNSAKVSGACGRLMCCLRYEHECYEEALKTTPPNGALVDTTAGTGVVIETRPLLQIVKVRLDEKPEAPRLFPCEEVTVLRHKAPKHQDGEKAEKATTERAAEPTEPKPEKPTAEDIEARKEERREKKREEKREEKRERENQQNHHGERKNHRRRPHRGGGNHQRPQQKPEQNS